MKYCLIILSWVLSTIVSAQSKQMIEILAKSKLLERTVFETKDSATLEELFAATVAYRHSDGRVESREEAIRNIIHNKSVYVITPAANGYNVDMKGDSASVKHLFTATERKADGTESALNLSILVIWIKEKGKWKVSGREAEKIQ